MAYVTEVNADNPSVYYRFDTANDSSGNGHTGAYVGTVTTDYTVSATGGPANGPYLRRITATAAGGAPVSIFTINATPLAARIAATSTIEFWVYCENNNAGGLLALLRNAASNSDLRLVLSTTTNGTNFNFTFGVRPPGITGGTTSQTVTTSSITPGGYAINTWHHIVIHTDFGSSTPGANWARVFVNGLLIGEIEVHQGPQGLLADRTPNLIALGSGASLTSNGSLSGAAGATNRRFAELAIYSGHLSYERISVHYAEGRLSGGNLPPAVMTLPTFTGTAQSGFAQTHNTTTQRGTWVNSPTSYAHEWRRGVYALTIDSTTSDHRSVLWTTISGFSNVDYTTTGSDTGNYLQLVVTGTNATGSTPGMSTPVFIDVGPPANSAAPAITGSAQAGQTLTVSTGTWSNSPTGYSYLWQRFNGSTYTPIGANANTYVVQAADAGQQIRCRVTATNGAGSTQAFSALTGVVTNISAPVNVVAPTITGATVVGSTLQVSTGEWQTSSNAPDPGLWQYQWRRSKDGFVTFEAVTGVGSQNTYVLSATDKEYSFIASVTARNAGGAQQTTVSSAAAGPVTEPAPQSVIIPSISAPDQPRVGDTLVANNGVWANTPTSYQYQWQEAATENGTYADISGATSSSFTLTASQLTEYVRCRVTAINGGGSTQAFSLAAGKAGTRDVKQILPPENIVPPSISGQAYLTNTLTANPGSWSRSPTSYAYQWQVSADGVSWANATGAGSTSASYTVAGADNNKYLRVVVTASNAGGASVAANSFATPLVSAQPFLWGYWSGDAATFVAGPPVGVQLPNHSALPSARRLDGSGAPSWAYTSGIPGTSGGNGIARTTAAGAYNLGVSLEVQAPSTITWNNMSFSGWVQWNADIHQFSAGTGVNADPKIVSDGTRQWYPVLGAWDSNDDAIYVLEVGVPLTGTRTIDRLRYRMNTGGTSESVTATIAPQPANTWTHVGFTSTENASNSANQDIAVYLNGTRVANATVTRPTPGSISGAVRLGYWTASAIDEVGIFTNALSQTQMADLYNAGAKVALSTSEYLEIPTTVRFKDLRIFGGDTGRLRGMWVEHNIHYFGDPDSSQVGPNITVDVDKDIDEATLEVGEVQPRRVAGATVAKLDKYFVTEFRGAERVNPSPPPANLPPVFPAEFSVLRVKVSDVGVTGNRPASGKIYSVRLLIEPTRQGRVDNPVLL